MGKKNSGTLKIAATYIGTVVGAGFATGQEILQFFAVFGINGLWGIFLTTTLFIFFGIIIMDLGSVLNARSHLEIVKYSGGRAFGWAMDMLISFFLFGSLTAMLAGTGALFKQQFGLWAVLGGLTMAVLSATTALSGKSGVFNSISIVVPFLLISVIAISAFSIIKSPISLKSVSSPANQKGLLGGWLLAAVLYTSYNTAISIGVLAPLGASAPQKSAIIKGGILGGLGLGLGSVMIYLAVSTNLLSIKALEVPMIYIAGGISKWVQIIYSVILIAEIYTTAVGSLYGFAARFVNAEKHPSRWVYMVIATGAAAFFASLLGFSNLVKYLYPLFGYAGILLLISLVCGKIKHKILKR